MNLSITLEDLICIENYGYEVLSVLFNGDNDSVPYSKLYATSTNHQNFEYPKVIIAPSSAIIQDIKGKNNLKLFLVAEIKKEKRKYYGNKEIISCKYDDYRVVSAKNSNEAKFIYNNFMSCVGDNIKVISEITLETK